MITGVISRTFRRCARLLLFPLLGLARRPLKAKAFDEHKASEVAVRDAQGGALL